MRPVIWALLAGASLNLVSTDPVQAQQALRVETDALTLAGPIEPQTLRVEAPGLTLAGPPLPQDLRIEAPLLTLVGRPEPAALRLELPALSLVSVPRLRIQVPRLTLVGPPEEDDGVESGDPPEPGELPPGAGGGGRGVGDLESAGCSGNYTVALGQPRAAGGMAMGRPETATAQVSTSACAAQMRVVVDGRAIDLMRQASGVYRGSIQGGSGQTIVYSLSCQPDLSLTGDLRASDGTLAVQRDITMTRTGGQSADLTGCNPG